ncbi:MAG TPA: DMT family transporter [Dysgonamonadaceae bacterium]|nr:DMT family transporter [Dysgonamonadaceae bacterium]
MSLFIALLLRILSNPFANVCQKKLTASRQNPLWVNFVGFFTLSMVCIPFLGKIPWSSFPPIFWIYCIAGGLLGSLGNGYLIKAVEKGDISLLGPINSYKSLISTLLGIPLLGELPNLWGLLGMGLIIYGSYFILDTLPERFSWQVLKRPEIKFRIYAMLLTAMEAIFIKKIIVLSSPHISFVMWCIFNAVFSFFFLFIYRISPKTQLHVFYKRNIPVYLALVACMGIMQMATNYSFAHMPVGYALALFQLSGIVSVGLGYAFFKEQNIRKKLFGTVIMIIGAVLIILFES